MLKLKTIIENNILSKKTPDVFLKDIVHINKFKFIEHKKVKDSDVWFFKRMVDDYIIKAYIIFDKKKTWTFKTLVFWKTETKKPTNGVGMDNTHSYGPYSNYENMVSDLENKLKNNLVLNPIIYHDNSELNKDKECLLLFKNLREYGEKINNTKHNYFDDLKKYYNDTKNMDDFNIVKYCQKIAPKDDDKQGLSLNLQKMYKLDFYNGIDNMFS